MRVVGTHYVLVYILKHAAQKTAVSRQKAESGVATKHRRRKAGTSTSPR
jgi:hypothetical protein